MEHAFRSVFQTGACSAVLVGTDIPELDSGIVRQSYKLLASHDAVLGPANDGGYYLLGLRKAVPELFRGIAWSTPRVYAETLEKIRNLKMTCAVLPLLLDIDTEADYQKHLNRRRLSEKVTAK
jgi:glycosyltransferase A (GT-A) superfamily protein (DUF2064 family)